MAQKGFFDLSDRYSSLDAKKDPLLEIDGIVPWEDFRPLLKTIWRKPPKDRKSRAGRKPWNEIIMFKALVLSGLYNLSDDQIAFQVPDRLSFMRFLGLGLEDSDDFIRRQYDATALRGLNGWAKRKIPLLSVEKHRP